MTARTEKHEQMPNEVAVAQTFVHEKEHASGIGNATGYQPEDRAKRAKRKRRVRPGNQQKNRRMIQRPQNSFPARLRPRMVERRSEIQHQHRDRKNRRAEKKAGTTAISFQEQNRCAD